MRKARFLLAAMVVLLALSGEARSDRVWRAFAVLEDPRGRVVGVASLLEDGRGRVHVYVLARGISPGQHGTHVHEVGHCDGGTDPPFVSAGGHFNPQGRQHGLRNPNGPHAGDLPNLWVSRAGVGYLYYVTDRFTLSPGPASLFDEDGSALVIHANPDDQVTDPTGNSGGRIACGVIEAD